MEHKRRGETEQDWRNHRISAMQRRAGRMVALFYSRAATYFHFHFFFPPSQAREFGGGGWSGGGGDVCARTEGVWSGVLVVVHEASEMCLGVPVRVV